MTGSELSFSPFFHPSVGLGSLRSLFDAMEGTTSPAYDIEQTGEDSYRIALAVPGFKPDALEVKAQGNLLAVRARVEAKDDAKQSEYLYRGIQRRSFNWSFGLADHVVVKSAQVKDGLLKIELVREVPEAEKPKLIEVKAA